MELKKKIDRQYKKFQEISARPTTIENDRAYDKAYDKVKKMFSSPGEFNVFWQGKSSASIYVMKR